MCVVSLHVTVDYCTYVCVVSVHLQYTTVHTCIYVCGVFTRTEDYMCGLGTCTYMCVWSLYMCSSGLLYICVCVVCIVVDYCTYVCVVSTHVQ